MQNSGFCQKGDVCTFAHSLQELAPGPELQTASPSSLTAPATIAWPSHFDFSLNSRRPSD